MNKHDLIDKHVDNGNIIDSENRISNLFYGHLSSVFQKSLKRLQRIRTCQINHI